MEKFIKKSIFVYGQLCLCNKSTAHSHMKRANKLNYQWAPSLDSDGKNAKLLLKKGTNWEKKLSKQYLTSVGPVMCLPSSLVALGRASGQELQFTCSIRGSSADATHRRALSSKADKQMRNRLKSVGKTRSHEEMTSCTFHVELDLWISLCNLLTVNHTITF